MQLLNAVGNSTSSLTISASTSAAVYGTFIVQANETASTFTLTATSGTVVHTATHYIGREQPLRRSIGG